MEPGSLTRPHFALDQFGPDLTPPGTKTTVWLRAFDELSGPVLLPGLIAHGARPGHLLLAVAGVHGDEYEGMEAIRRCFAELDPARMRGVFAAIPVANPFAYESRIRATPSSHDGLNLARVFPGDAAGSPTRRLAAALLAAAERLVGPNDLFLDFHSGSADADYGTVVGIRDVDGPARAQSEAAARSFGLSRLWLIGPSPGPFNAETALRGIPTIGTETTGRAGCLPEDVAAYQAGLHNLLAFLGISGPNPPKPAEGSFRAAVDVLSPLTGFFRPAKRLYDPVEQGERIGAVIDLFGETLGEITVPVSGEFWSMRAMPAVRAGELIGMIAVSEKNVSEVGFHG